ncbi:hypothetical protein EK21DRAFT_95131 [Setomelanomma holmii]|uniref:Uncharacterized protein n=1 Tax=Setomelanomma holmii TaxID=210430 RepID=A0A9P4GWC7_9PLEO|nr:hypothetical protein EK21DRAFT_95131 [Setomelanomma holmii]
MSTKRKHSGTDTDQIKRQRPEYLAGDDVRGISAPKDCLTSDGKLDSPPTMSSKRKIGDFEGNQVKRQRLEHSIRGDNVNNRIPQSYPMEGETSKASDGNLASALAPPTQTRGLKRSATQDEELAGDRKKRYKFSETQSFLRPRIQPMAECFGWILLEQGKLYLTKVSYSGTSTYALMSTDQLDSYFPQRVMRCDDRSSGGNWLSDERRRFCHTTQHYPRDLVDIAWDISFGICVPPPHWKVLERYGVDKLPIESEMLRNGLFSTVVLILWTDGEQTWEFVAEAPSEFTHVFCRSLLTLGQRNEASFRDLVSQHYTDVYSKTA